MLLADAAIYIYYVNSVVPCHVSGIHVGGGHSTSAFLFTAFFKNSNGIEQIFLGDYFISPSWKEPL